METTRVKEIMSSPVIVAGPDTKIPVAITLMRENHIRHLPVVENGRLLGILSQGDLREASSKAAINANSYELNFQLSRMEVSSIMTHNVFTISPDAFIVQAAELMTEHKIAGLPVLDSDDSLVGMVTESDLLKLLARYLNEQMESRAKA